MTTPQAETDLMPIDRDEGMKRDYIPLPGGWEIQTKGKGSTFRIANSKTGNQYPIIDDMAHKALVEMAMSVREAWNTRAALTPKPAEGGAETGWQTVAVARTALVRLIGDGYEERSIMPAIGRVERIVSNLRARVAELEEDLAHTKAIYGHSLDDQVESNRRAVSAEARATAAEAELATANARIEEWRPIKDAWDGMHERGELPLKAKGETT